MILQFVFNGIALGAIYSIVAFGFGLIYTTTKILHISHAAVFTVTSYLFYTLLNLLHLDLYTSIAISVLLGGCLGLLLELCLYRPLAKKKASSSSFLIASLGLYIFIQNLISMIFGNQNLFISTEPAGTFQLGSVIIGHPQVLYIVFAVALFTLLFIFLRRTNLGKDIAAFADNAQLAEILGFNIRFLRLVVFFLGSSLSGIGAVLLSMDLGIDPHFGLNIILISLISVTVGGVGVLISGAIGGLFVGFIQGVVAIRISAQWESTTVFLLLVLFLLFRPYGLIGKKRRIEELS